MGSGADLLREHSRDLIEQMFPTLPALRRALPFAVPSASLTRILIAAIALQLGLGVVALGTVEGDSSPLAAGGSDTTAVTAVEGQTSEQQDDPAAESPAAPSSGAPSAQPGQPGQQGQSADEIPRSPRLGRYTYRTSSTSSTRGPSTTTKETSSEVTYRLVAMPPENGNVRVRRYVEGSNGWTDNAYRRDGQYILGTGGENNGEQTQCDWQPDILAVKWGAAVGTSWAVDSRCTSTSDGAKSEIHEQGTVRVVGTKTLTIGGRRVDTKVLEKKTTTTIVSTSPNFAEPVKFVIEEQTTFHYSESHRLNVLQESVHRRANDFKTPDGVSHHSEDESRTRAELVSLDPT